MNAGQKVYKAYSSGGGYSSEDPPFELIFEGTVVEVVRDGTVVQGVERLFGNPSGGMVEPLTSRWHERRCDALREFHRELIRYIGSQQAKADDVAARILCADLMDEEEVTSGVA